MWLYLPTAILALQDLKSHHRLTASRLYPSRRPQVRHPLTANIQRDVIYLPQNCSFYEPGACWTNVQDPFNSRRIGGPRETCVAHLSIRDLITLVIRGCSVSLRIFYFFLARKRPNLIYVRPQDSPQHPMLKKSQSFLGMKC